MQQLGEVDAHRPGTLAACGRLDLLAPLTMKAIPDRAQNRAVE